MVGVKAATGNGLAAQLRHGILERTTLWLRERGARAVQAAAEQLAATTWTEQAWHDHADLDRTARDPGATPLRGLRLT